MDQPANRLPAVVLVVTLVVAAITILATAGLLPPIVASHFDARGAANGFSPRGVYIGVMLAVAVGLPVLIPLSMRTLRGMPDRLINLPRRDYWLAPAHREEAIAALTSYGCVIGIAVSVFCVGVHLFVLNGNLAAEQALSPAFIAWLVMFLATIAVIVGAMLSHFARPPR